MQAESTTLNPSATMSQETRSQLGDHDSTALIHLLSVSRTVLLQAVDVLDNYLTSDDQLTAHSRYLPGSTIGKHLRHARDHFVLLADSVTTSSSRELSYDTRIRNTPMETSRTVARQALLDTVKQLEEIVPMVEVDEPLVLNAVTPYMQSFKTTFGRELWFAALHCVHHWSMVRVIAGELDIKLTDDFGFAPSTLVYQGRDGALGKAKI